MNTNSELESLESKLNWAKFKWYTSLISTLVFIILGMVSFITVLKLTSAEEVSTSVTLFYLFLGVVSLVASFIARYTSERLEREYLYLIAALAAFKITSDVVFVQEFLDKLKSKEEDDE